MMMLKKIIPVWLIMLLCSSQTLAWVPAAPDEAIFFEDANFKGASLALQLQPGVRHRLMPGLEGLNKKISSMLVGKNVKVLVFTNPDYEGAVREYRYTIAEHMPDDDQIASLIVCPQRGTAPRGIIYSEKNRGG